LYPARSKIFDATNPNPRISSFSGKRVLACSIAGGFLSTANPAYLPTLRPNLSYQNGTISGMNY
jgi:hypothetical protein